MNTSFRHMQGSPRQSRILDSTPWIPDTSHWILADSLSVELGFRILVLSAIPDSSNCIPDSKAQDSGFYKKRFRDSAFHKQKFPGFPRMLRKSYSSSLSSNSPRCLPTQTWLRNRTGGERRRQTLRDKRDNNFVWNNFSQTCTVKDQKTLMLEEITTKQASNSLVTFVTHKRFAVLLRKLTIHAPVEIHILVNF